MPRMFAFLADEDDEDEFGISIEHLCVLAFQTTPLVHNQSQESSKVLEGALIHFNLFYASMVCP